MKVCHLASGDLWAGAEVQVATMCESLAMMPQVEVSAIFFNEGQLAESVRAVGIPVTVLPENEHGFFGLLKLTQEVIRKQRPDILHTHRSKENMIGALVKRSGDVTALVQTVHGLGEPFRGLAALRASLHERIVRFVTPRYFDMIFPVSHDIERHLSRVYPRMTFRVIHNAVRAAAPRTAEQRRRIRTELGIADDEFLIGTAGRFVPVKAYDMLLDSLAGVMQEHSQARAIIVGDGPLQRALTDRATALGLDERVVFPGFRHDIEDVISGMDLFVISSRHEGIPTVLLEAMTLRVPVVSTAVGGIPEVVTDGETALLTPPGNPEALATAMNRIMSDQPLRENLVDAAQGLVLASFTAMAQANKLVLAYKELIG